MAAIRDRASSVRGPVRAGEDRQVALGGTAQPRVAIVADDLVARRLEGLLAADGMRGSERAAGVAAVDPRCDVLVMTFGAGITERDHVMRVIAKTLPRVRLVAIMSEDSRRGVRRAVEAGAAAVVFEPEIEAALVPTIRAVLAGQMAVPAARRHEVDRPTLSNREKQILRMVVAGMGNKSIARELFLAESTVKCHLSSAFGKLGVRSRHEAADLILQSGADLGPGNTPSRHATTEGSTAMNHTQHERGVRA